MPAGVGVGVGVGDGLEEMDALPPHALITAETSRRLAERKIEKRLELSEGLIGVAYSPSWAGMSALDRDEAHGSLDAL
jgi:hypothetical protein